MIFRNFRVANSSFFLTNGATSAICSCPFRLGDLRAVPRGIVFGLAIAFVSVCRFLASAQLESCSGFRPAETPGRFVAQIRSSNRRRGERRSAGDLCVASPLSNCDLNMRSAPYAEHGEVVSWLFRPEMRRAIPGSYFVRTKYRFFALVLFRCRSRMQLFGAAARSCGRRAGSRIGRLRDSAVSRPRFRSVSLPALSAADAALRHAPAVGAPSTSGPCGLGGARAFSSPPAG